MFECCWDCVFLRKNLYRRPGVFVCVCDLKSRTSNKYDEPIIFYEFVEGSCEDCMKKGTQ